MLVSNRQSVTSHNQEPNNELTNATATTSSDNHQKTEPKITDQPTDKVSEVSHVETVAPVLPLPDIVHNTAIIVRHPTDQAKCLSPRSQDMTPTKPRQNQQITKAPLPDLINDSLHAIKKTPRKTQRKVFRLNTLRDLHQQRQSATKDTTPSPLSWREAGAKLRDVAATWETPVRRPSLPLFHHDTNNRQLQQRRLSSLSPDTLTTPEPGHMSPHDDDDLDGPRYRMKNDIDTQTMINNVLKAVQVFGLFLIIRKFENMLK